jgi:hypothetical protein
MMALEIFKIRNLHFEIVRVVTSNICHKEGAEKQSRNLCETVKGINASSEMEMKSRITPNRSLGL